MAKECKQDQDSSKSLSQIYGTTNISDLKGALQILGRKFYKNTKKSSLYSTKPFNFHS